MDAIETIDVTDRAVAGGWRLPDGWTVRADVTQDDGNMRPDEWADECYTPAQVAAWLRDDWTYMAVSVWVEDDAGREWGHDSIGMVEAGSFVLTDEDDNVTGSVDLDPLRDAHPIADHDMIGEALRDAVDALAAFGAPVITAPVGALTGL